MTRARRLWAALLVASTCGAGALTSAAVGPPWWSRQPRPCRWSPTLTEAKRSLDVFEGVVVDHWDETVLDGWRIRVLRTYRFQVLRHWTSAAGSERHLVQGWYEGEWYMEGAYPVFERGHRYLITSVLHDCPAHSFTTSCLPGAEGDAIAPLADELGPPLVTFKPRPLPQIPFWLPLARSAKDATRFTFMVGYRLGTLVARAGF